MSHTSEQVALRARHAPIESMSAVQGARAGFDYSVSPGASNLLGQYDSDSAAKERLRTYYDTLAQVQQGTNAAAADNALNPVQRVAPVTEQEISAVAEMKELELEHKWARYWNNQMHPAQPWTMAEVAKIDPSVVGRKVNAIRNAAQFALDQQILRHVGHGGDRNLAYLQYMIDQGEMDHMPTLVRVNEADTVDASPFSIWALSGETRQSRQNGKQTNAYRTNGGLSGDNNTTGRTFNAARRRTSLFAAPNMQAAAPQNPLAA